MRLLPLRLSQWLRDVCYSLAETALSLAYRVLYAWHPRRVPHVTDPVLLLSARELAVKIRSRELSSRRVLEAYMSRIRVVQPIINAVTDYDWETALREADEADRVMREAADTPGELSRLAREKPFLGVPMSVKDLYFVKGLFTTAGLWWRRRAVAYADAEAVTALKNIGFIVLCHTNMPELGMWLETHNHQWGRTLNPYDTWRTCGGSSGGDAALVGAAGAPIGLGSDIGGSIRMPAAMCGCFGHKHTSRLVRIHPYDGTYPPASTAKRQSARGVGPIARHAEDLWPFQLAVSDPLEVEKLVFKTVEEIDIHSIKYYYLESLNQLGTSKEYYVSTGQKGVINSVQKVVSSLREFGADVSPLPVSVLTGSDPDPITTIILGHSYYLSEVTPQDVEMMRPVGMTVREKDNSIRIANTSEVLLGFDPHRSLHPYWQILKATLWPFKNYEFKPSTLWYLAAVKRVSKVSANKKTEITKRYREMSERLDAFFARNNHHVVLIMPVWPRPANLHRAQYLAQLDWAYTCIPNDLGFPATSCPTGLDSTTHVPIGVQVIGGRYCDCLTIAVAMKLEKLLGGWVNP